MSDTAQDATPADNVMNHIPAGVPPQPPGVGSALGRGWRSMQSNFLVYFLAVLVLAAFLQPVNFSNDGDHVGDSGL